MQSVLHVADAASAAADFSTLASHLDEVRKNSGFELNIANSLWAESSITFEARFLDLLKNRYGSELMKVDYRKNPEDARGRINAWISDKTKEKIPELIPSGALSRDTRLVLANAIYFKAAWLTPFTKAATRDGDFTTSGGKTVKAKMMHEKIETRYAETDALQVLDLPYKRGTTSMIILLPKNKADIGPAERQLDAIKDLQFRRASVQTTLPRFKIRYQTDVSQTLAKLGMPLAFSGQADFSGMTRDDRVAISNVIHEAYVDVNEEGTEAAAATAVVMRATAMPVQQQVVTFTADHPFAFAIRDNQSGVILFVGRLVDPS
jgi:serpin B